MPPPNLCKFQLFFKEFDFLQESLDRGRESLGLWCQLQGECIYQKDIPHSSEELPDHLRRD